MTTTPSRITEPLDHSRADTRNGNHQYTEPKAAGGSLVGDIRLLLDRSGTLVRQELELMRAEARLEVDKYAKAATAMGAGLGVALAGCIVLSLALVVGLYVALAAAGLDRNAAGLISVFLVGIVVLAIGGAMVGAAKKKLSEPPSLKRTVQEAERTAAWAKEKV